MFKNFKLLSILKIWAIAVIVWNFISSLLNWKAKVDSANSQPEGRTEKINEPDANGLKQVQAGYSIKPKPVDIPVGVTPTQQTNISGEGSLKSVPSNSERSNERPTGDIIDEIDKALEESDKE